MPVAEIFDDKKDKNDGKKPENRLEGISVMHRDPSFLLAFSWDAIISFFADLRGYKRMKN